ncbi:hypothetical protein EWB00_000610, partial [Schistosoma japonicum]
MRDKRTKEQTARTGLISSTNLFFQAVFLDQSEEIHDERDDTDSVVLGEPPVPKSRIIA